MEASETEKKIALIEERIKDRYNIKVPENIVVDRTEEQLELEIAKIQRSLENIGPVNMAVQDEYNEELERLETLSIQRDDLNNIFWNFYIESIFNSLRFWQNFVMKLNLLL